MCTTIGKKGGFAGYHQQLLVQIPAARNIKEVLFISQNCQAHTMLKFIKKRVYAGE
jgi:hypothetical protein